MAGRLSWRWIFSLSRKIGEPVSIKAEHDVWSCWDEIVVGIITPDFSCEAETSCSVKLAKTKGRVVVFSTVGGGLTSLFGIRSESVDGVERGGVGVFNRREGLFLQSLKSVERYQQYQYYC